jgi:copper chaperone CopZ
VARIRYEEIRYMSHTTLKIDGMSCGHCVTAVKKALEGLDGVTVESVAIGSATVEYDPAVVSPEKIVGAVSDAGYSAAPAA